ncbi:MAG: ankyrin repeat domain-containing protein [Actinomycetota bacterium]
MDPEYETAAIAIYTGDLSDLDRELTAKPELVTRRSSCGHPTLLQLVACEAADLVNPVGAARLLVERGAETWFPVVSAAGCNSAEVLRFLIDSGAAFDRDDSWTPLEEALYWNSQDTVQVLVEHQAPVRSLAAAAGLGDLNVINGFLDGDPLRSDAGPVRSPFPDTVPYEMADDPQAIINHGFVMAANTGQLEAAKRLRTAGARVNERPPGYHWHGTALHAACWRGDPSLVGWLISIGADPAIRDGLADADATGWATHHGHPDLLPLLQQPPTP